MISVKRNEEIIPKGKFQSCKDSETYVIDEKQNDGAAAGNCCSTIFSYRLWKLKKMRNLKIEKVLVSVGK